MMETCCFCFQSSISPYATRALILFWVTPFIHWILSAEIAGKTLLGWGSLSRPENQAMLKVTGPKLLQLWANPETSTWVLGREGFLFPLNWSHSMQIRIFQKPSCQYKRSGLAWDNGADKWSYHRRQQSQEMEGHEVLMLLPEPLGPSGIVLFNHLKH